ncbi:hypothetical protein B0H10DRAFT_1959255 [Mycena sp. CBHHK59/15]|nr:hypothetical protein B0H10DRAFT_1959255 [Mycena sp. CBHHK59/15]
MPTFHCVPSWLIRVDNLAHPALREPLIDSPHLKAWVISIMDIELTIDQAMNQIILQAVMRSESKCYEGFFANGFPQHNYRLSFFFFDTDHCSNSTKCSRSGTALSDEIISFDLPFMINIFALSSLVLATLHMAVAPASAHGYVSHPPSRQALCRDVPVPGYGDLVGRSFQRGPPRSRPSLLHVDTHSAARHATWEYFILTEHNTKLASFDDGGAVPPRTVVHQVPLHGYTGRQTILARWNIADTPATFYACVDLNINPTNTATAVAGAAAAQQPIGIPLAGPGLGLARANGSSSAMRALRHAPDIIAYCSVVFSLRAEGPNRYFLYYQLVTPQVPNRPSQRSGNRAPRDDFSRGTKTTSGKAFWRHRHAMSIQMGRF